MSAASTAGHGSWRHYVDLLAVLTAKEIKVRYKRTALGYAWSLLNPIIHAITFWIAFKAILNVRIEGYFVFLLAGLFPWQWLSSSLLVAPMAFIRNETLIKKVAFPRHLIVLALVVTEGLHFLLCLPVFFAIEFLSGHRGFHAAWLWGIPILTVIQGLVIYGCALAVASFNVFLRDIERLLALAMTVLFYLTPVIYRPEMVPPSLRPWIALNPFVPIIVAWRDLLLDGRWNGAAVAHAAPVGVLCAMLGYALFARVKWKLAEAL